MPKLLPGPAAPAPPASAADLEAFEAHVSVLTAEWWPPLGLLIAAAALLWWPLDPLIYPDAPEAVAGMRDLRLQLLVLNPILALLAPRLRSARAYALPAAFCAGLANLALAGWALGSLAGGGILGLAYGFLGPQFAILLLLPLGRRVLATAAFTAVLVMAWWAHPATGLGDPGVPAALSFLAFATCLAVFLGHVGYVLLRRSFLLGRQVDRQRDELARLADHLEERVADQTAALRTLHERARQVRAEERKEVARDLHDSLGQELLSLRLLLGVGRQIHAEAPVQETLAELEGQVERVQGSMRRVLEALGPPGLEEVGLVEAVAGLVGELERRSGLRMELQAGAVPQPLDPAVARTAYRVVQEGLNNALRHARAATVTVRLAGDADTLEIEVCDDGRGTAPERVGAGMGTRGIRARARALGGEALWRSGEEGAARGTTLQVRLPLRGAP